MGAPEFSVVIPAFDVEGYLRQAVMSVATDPRAEVIIVDDCSTDGTAALAEELAREWPTVTLVRPDANVGLGRARNLGLARSRGDYVLFVDGDDYLVDGALDRIAQAIETATPDVVLFGYERLYANGHTFEGMRRSPLQLPGPFTAADHPDVFDVLNVAWNKAYRRDFLLDLGVEFPVGYYEDIPWTYPVLARAASIVGIDAPLYRYRQRWSGSILRSTDARHLEMVDQFGRLMDVLERLDVEAGLRREIFTRAVLNILTLATTQNHRIPASLRREYYERAAAAVKERRPQGWEVPETGDRAALMRAFWDRDYEGFVASQRARPGASWLVARAKSAARRAAGLGRLGLRPHRTYAWHRRFTPVDPHLVVLENLWGVSPRLNCLAVARELQRSHPEMRLVWSVLADEADAVPDDMDWVVRGSHAYHRALAEAAYVFLDVNLPGWWRKRPGQTLVQLHHGTPLKLMGVEERGVDRPWKDALLKRCSQWDYSVVSNAYSAEVWKHSYPVRCETLECGYPRNDVLVDPDAETVARARERAGVAQAEHVVLYAPTFRERDQDSLPLDDLNAVAESLEPGSVLLVRGHYFAGRTATAPHARLRDVTEYPAVEDLYLAADVLVTDYSSVMFDYANLRRPIVIFAYDWAEYERDRGTYFDITVDAPGPVVTDVASLARALRERTYDDQENRERLERFADIFTCYETGHAARDVVARTLDGRDIETPSRHALPALTSWRMDRVA